MRTIILAAGAALTLVACNNNAANDQANADMNLGADNGMMADQNMMMDQNMGDMNAAGGADGNMATNAATENAMAKDMNTNDPDTNLANGM